MQSEKMTERIVVRVNKQDIAEIEKIQKIEGGKISTVTRKLLREAISSRNLDENETAVFKILDDMLDAKIEKLGNRVVALLIKNIKNSGQSNYLLIQLLKENGLKDFQIEEIVKAARESSVRDLKNNKK